MTTNTSAVKPKAPLSPLRIVSSAMYLLFGILTAVSVPHMTAWHIQVINYFSDPLMGFGPEFASFLLDGQYLLVSTIATPFLAVAIAIVGFIPRFRWLQPALGVVLFVAAFVVAWIFDFVKFGAIEHWTQSVDVGGSYFDNLIGWIALAVFGLALVLSVVASLISTKSPGIQTEPEESIMPEPAQSSQNASAKVAGQSNLTNLPLFALIGAFIVPLAGIILGHLSLSYMKKGQLSTQNKGMATAGLILGYVFVGLGFLTGLILVIVLIVSAASGF